MKRVIVVGGGIAGVMAASMLQERKDIEVLVVEKSRSVGGRLATRRIGEGKADHGAQFFTARTSELQEKVEEWLAKDWIRLWYADPYPRYRGTDGMNGLVKELARNLHVQLHTKVEHVYEMQDGLRLKTEDGSELQADAVIVTAPAPQAAMLLKQGGIQMPELETLTFNPCFVAMLTLTEPAVFPETGHLTEGLPEGVERMVDHQKKGMSKLPVVSVYMKGEWSKQHYGLSEEEVMGSILHQISGFMGEGELCDKQLKRWRYAEAERVIKQPFLDAKTAHPLLIAGDAFLYENDPSGRTRFESAFVSGMEAGKALANRL